MNTLFKMMIALGGLFMATGCYTTTGAIGSGPVTVPDSAPYGSLPKYEQPKVAVDPEAQRRLEACERMGGGDPAAQRAVDGCIDRAIATYELDIDRAEAYARIEERNIRVASRARSDYIRDQERAARANRRDEREAIRNQREAINNVGCVINIITGDRRRRC